MKKVKCLFVVLVFLALALLQAPQAFSGQEVVTLKMADTFPIKHFCHECGLYFIKRVKEISGNKVQIKYFPAGQMGKLKDSFNMTAKGLVDISYIMTTFEVGKVPLNTVAALPYFTTAVEGTEIRTRQFEVCPELTQEYLNYGARPLIHWSTNQYDVGTVKKAVQSPEDLKGLKLKCAGGLFERIAKLYGIIPIALPPVEVYQAVQRGIVDGCILSLPSVKGYRLNELEKYHTIGLRMGASPSGYIINEKKWQSLSKEVKEVLQQAGSDCSRFFAEGWDGQSNDLMQKWEKEGMVFHRIQSQDRHIWDAPLQGISDVWIQDMEKRDLPARKIYQSFRKICQEVVK